MANASTRAVSGVVGVSLRHALMAGISGAVLVGFASSSVAAPDCAVGTAGDDVCIITLNNTGNESVDALGNTAAGDRLQFGGAADFSFDAGRIGAETGLRNFELYEKIDAVVVTLTGTATVQTNWNVLAGTLQVTGSTATGQGNISDASSVTVASGATFGLLGVGGNSEVIGSLSGVAGSFVTLGGTGTLTAGGNSATTTFAGVMSGTGGFRKVGGGTMTLTNANTFTGALLIDGGILEIGTGGSIASATAVSTSSVARLTGTTAYTINAPVINLGQITGNVTINGNVTNNGGLLPGNSSIPPGGGTTTNPGQDMGTILINGNYATSGKDAYFGMFVDLDAGTQDFVNITGNVSGTDPTYLYIVEFDAAADPGFATTGNGIQVIRVGGTTTAGAFRQGTSITAGSYQYLLRHVANYNIAGDDGYFLQSAARDEISAHPALLTAGQNLIRNCFRDGQRVPDSPKGASFGRAWFGYHQGNTGFGADTGVDMDQDYSCTSGGMDWRMGHGWFGGVSGGFGSTKADLVAPAGIGTLDGDARVIEAYASFTSSSLFVNLSAGYNDMDWLYDGALASSSDASSSGFIASAQAGVALGIEAVAIKLIGSINYDGTNCGDSCFGFAATEDTDIIDAKGTIRFDSVASGGSVRPWAAVSYSDVVSGGVNTVKSGPFTASSDSLNQLLSLDAGLQTYLDENLSLYLDGGYHESLGKDVSGYKAGIGMKLYW